MDEMRDEKGSGWGVSEEDRRRYGRYGAAWRIVTADFPFSWDISLTMALAATQALSCVMLNSVHLRLPLYPVTCA